MGRAVVPRSIGDVSAIAFGNFGEIRIDTFELLVDDSIVLKS